MARRSRASDSGFYHVRLRGNGRQLLFLNDDDRRAFLSILDEALADNGVALVAYCLMDNHVHLVLDDPQGALSRAMHRVAMGYARRFNAVNGHGGHVFEGRFKSTPVEDDAYLLTVVRYVHDNPEKAGICRADEYRWSSYATYVSEDGRIVGRPRVAVEPVLSMVGGREAFAEASRAPMSGGEALRLPLGPHPTDAERDEAVRAALGDLRPMEVASLPVERRADAVRALWAEGLSIRQIERLCAIGRNTVARIVHNQ